jgi:hypothetical protein
VTSPSRHIPNSTFTYLMELKVSRNRRKKKEFWVGQKYKQPNDAPLLMFTLIKKFRGSNYVS